MKVVGKFPKKTAKAPLAFLGEHLHFEEAVDEAEAKWEKFQARHLQKDGLLGICVKSRQIGWSWLAAAEAVANGCLHDRTTSIFVSLNHTEAAEKIRYARQIIDALSPQVKPQLIIDSRLELEFQNGSRLISHPCTPVRGKTKAAIYLDEFAHYPNDRAIYTAALPTTTKGGQLRIGSSPLGAAGLFWEIYTQALRAYPGFVRQRVPWWQVRGLSRDPRQAARVAPSLLTPQRVERFATPRLREIYDNLPLDDFQQEYECAWVDEQVAWIPWEEIKRNQQPDLLSLSAATVSQAFTALDQLALLIGQGRVEQTLAGGMDIGRTRNTTELFLVGKGEAGGLPLRLTISLNNTDFADQEAVLDRALTLLPITKLLIDRTGLGMQLAEHAKARHGARVEGVTFTADLKEAWSVELKVQMQKGRVPLPLERDLSYQIHSLKKIVTPAHNVIFDQPTAEKHHADKYWALALAVWAARPNRREAVWGPNPVRDPRDNY